MDAYAVVNAGGKQYRVKPGDVLKIELVDAQPGEKIQMKPVLALSDGNNLKLGTPEIAGAVVTAMVQKNIRDKKVVSFKKKRRKGYSRKKGHRQSLTVVTVESIG